MKLSIATASLLASAALAAEFRFTNKCDYTINLHAGGSVFVCDIPSGETRNNNCGATLGSHGLFKHTAANDVNLLEYSLTNTPGFNNVWYDVSNIPPGPGNCMSYADCKAFTGKKGYNVPMSIRPTVHNNGKNCRDLVVTSPDSPVAYLFPSDDGKMADCKIDEVFDVTFCPGGPHASSHASSHAGSHAGAYPGSHPGSYPSSYASTVAELECTDPDVIPDGQVGPWQQCGGKGYSGSSTCTDGYACQGVNEWFSLCHPLPPKEGELATWAQCGGKGYTGITKCQARDECWTKDEHFSQCIPASKKST
ncbi:hypothetical protein SPRG_19307 [Saprolegnia parasitica CBS 223.65]|uniref:CBM1 domain-containing protein n=1 Tax=Saprolegnia parasitica (strain CBS 223.65) TaxID=695850 RepID=A0A067D4U3_SAPPC|nr:hypothetical protein SPRG_19307 [Saprolegnia parasitica CBS 223.65]KDO33696.1 hypothetical protein SPRG_19307 [Saprolegnia parasitica CBS 223.65]|eukprot:XP_012195719.1 hypothetical protein SPRG_19307 [Saprolegnia parasitica CBS 223.65]